MKKTVLNDRHLALGAKMVEFGGWHMPLHYASGIIEEHLLTRRQAGLFDVSHMGRIIIKGENGLSFLQNVLTANAAGLTPGKAQYTMIPTETGGAVDDAYLYHFVENEYLLVVNAANREKDWRHLTGFLPSFSGVDLTDISDKMAMLSLQGPLSRDILLEVLDQSFLPEPLRNSLSINSIKGKQVLLARTGYTGEALGFELFVQAADAGKIWDMLLDRGASPIGLGARDTTRLEAGLPLYGHELGLDPTGREIPIFASSLARYAVSLNPVKGNFTGRQALELQLAAYEKIINNDYSNVKDLPAMIRPLAILGKGIARHGAEVYQKEKQIGWVTSGTMAPYWKAEGSGLANRLSNERGKRAIALALIDSRIDDNELLTIDIRGKRIKALTVPYNLRSEAPPFCRAIIHEHGVAVPPAASGAAGIVGTTTVSRVQELLDRAIENTIWRQEECINLIPSEQSQSPLVRLLTIMDPVHRYGEHKKVKAFLDTDVFYYQGTAFIDQVERLLEEELKLYFDCAEVETRVISGQMANMTVFSALVDYLNRGDRKSEPRRMRSVLNNHIIKGGHLSAQPMGALRDYVARDPKTDKPAVVNFPVLKSNPYRIDISLVGEILDRFRPELIILGKSMVLHKEPVAEVRGLAEEVNLDTIIMYDMAHVLGLVGPHFQEPFKEGADLVTGSTHKTFFGTQRGIVSANYGEREHKYPLWEAVRRRTFPGGVSNHHLGTLLGLLMAAYEMNYYKDSYQKMVLSNARAFAAALKGCGMDVAGDPSCSYTETHQVVVNVGYSRGIEIAALLEENNIIVNFQAAPAEEGFTASGSLRMGVPEMTRFGMKAEHFQTLAQYIHDVVVKGKRVKEEIKTFRKSFTELQYCFTGKEMEEKISRLHQLI